MRKNLGRKTLTESIRIRILTRHIIRIVCGDNAEGQQYKRVNQAIQNSSKNFRHHKIDDGNSDAFSEATWSRWFNGGNPPNTTFISLLDTVFNGAASHWMQPGFQYAVVRNLTFMDLFHKAEKLYLDSFLKELAAAINTGLELWYASGVGVDLPGNGFKKVSNDHNVDYRQSRYMKIINPGEPYSIQRAFICFLVESGDEEIYDACAFDYVTMCILIYQYADKHWENIPVPPQGHGLNLARTCMFHLFSPLTSEQAASAKRHPRIENITRLLSCYGLEYELEAVISALNKVKFSYYDQLALFAGMTQKEVIDALMWDYGS